MSIPFLPTRSLAPEGGLRPRQLHRHVGPLAHQSLVFHVFNVFLGVAPGLISTALMVRALVDAGSDAIFGWLSDNTRTRGRRRFILVGGILAGIGLPLMFAVGRDWTEGQYFAFSCSFPPACTCP